MTTEPFGERKGLGSGLKPTTVPSKPTSSVLSKPVVPRKTLGMNGAFALNEAEIAKHCSPLRPHGNYAFGNLNEKGAFLVYYVGRFNHGGKRLKHGIGKYQHFMISHAATEKEAVEKECRNYHDYTPPHNKIHPACPEGLCCPHGCK
ncbi:MAG: hypothetical protein ACJ741_08080 [Pyrinomonadaceae bacterium]